MKQDSNHSIHFLATVCSLAVLWLATPAALGGDVTVEVSTRETFVNAPFTLRIIFENTKTHQRPDNPEIPGALVRLNPNPTRKSFTQISNGQTSTTNSLIYIIQITPLREGLLIIPAFSLKADGRITRTQPIEVLVTRATAETDSSELILIDIEAARDTYYLGEAVQVTLRIWVRPYRDQTYNITVSRPDTWRMVNRNLSSWGEFKQVIDDLEQTQFPGFRNSASVPEGGEELRIDESGNRRSYYHYELPAIIWPKQAGTLRMDDVKVIMDYPTRLQRRRSLLSNSFSVAESKLIAATIDSTTITIKPTPEAGRPASFAGAVGRYAISVQAQPTQVGVGDPITIAIDIRDRTGNSRLDVLLPPALEATSELVENFRIPTDPLAGEVVGNTKRFIQTIRAKSDQVDRIPPLQFAYFDPVRETYVTLESNPIPLTVSSSPTLSMTDVIEAPTGAPKNPTAPTQLTQVSGGLLANYTDPDTLLSSQTLTIGFAYAGVLAVPPLLAGAIVLIRRRSERLRTDTAYSRRKSAKRIALKRLALIGDDNAVPQLERIAEALSDYVADRCNLPPGAMTRSEITDLLRQCLAGGKSGGAEGEMIESVDALLAECERSRYAGGGQADVSSAAERATDLINRLERETLA